MVTEQEIKVVYSELQNRQLHPSGTFDTGGRWYATNNDLINVRRPSKSYPYSEMMACRTLKYVKAIVDKFQPATIEELRKLV